ncbi:hypothetical protein GQ44DRAFT_559562, partial [Phaeosphaeriaceae sp. PMI808]
IRAMQIDLRNQFLEDAISRIQRLRLHKKEYWDDTKEVNRDSFAVGDLVLLWDSLREIDMSRNRKLDMRWLGPYRILTAKQERGTYHLEDLDGKKFAHTTPGWKLKTFQQRTEAEIREEDRG